MSDMEAIVWIQASQRRLEDLSAHLEDGHLAQLAIEAARNLDQALDELGAGK